MSALSRISLAVHWKISEFLELLEPFTQKDLRRTVDYHAMDLGFAASDPSAHELDRSIALAVFERFVLLPFPFKVIEVVIEYIPYFLRSMVCIVLGHPALEDHGWATPDSGCIQMSCSFCGKSYGTTWLY